jgi:hypothetical protein
MVNWFMLVRCRFFSKRAITPCKEKGQVDDSRHPDVENGYILTFKISLVDELQWGSISLKPRPLSKNILAVAS